MTELPEGWVLTTLGQACEVNPKLDVQLDDDKLVSFVPMAAVEQESGRLDASLTRRVGDLRRKSYRHFIEGDVLVAKITPSMENGKAALAHGLEAGAGFGSTEFHVLRPREGVDGRYVLRFVLQSGFRSEAARHMTGTAGQLRVPASYLRESPIPLPPLDEQQRIVAVIEEQFSRLDAAEATLVRATRGLTKMEAGALKGLIDGGWVERPLREFLIQPLRNGHSSKAAPAGQGGVRTLTLTAVTARDFSEKNTKVTVAAPEKVEDLWLEPGDILIERSNTSELVGTAAIYEGEPGWAIFPDLMIRARVGGEVLPQFVDLVLRTATVRHHFRASAQGIAGSMPKISQSTVEELLIPVPPLSKQKEIVSGHASVVSLVAALRRSLTVSRHRARGLRSVILRDAFSGRLVARHASSDDVMSGATP